MFAYPPYGGINQPPNVIYVPVQGPAPQGQTPTQIDEMIKLLKAARKEAKKKEGSDKGPPKKEDDKKKDGMTYFQQVACWVAISPFIILANVLVIGGSFKFLRGVFGS